MASTTEKQTAKQITAIDLDLTSETSDVRRKDLRRQRADLENDALQAEIVFGAETAKNGALDTFRREAVEHFRSEVSKAKTVDDARALAVNLKTELEKKRVEGFRPVIVWGPNFEPIVDFV